MRYNDYKGLVNLEFLPPESLILAIEPLIPFEPPKCKGSKGGRPRKPAWKMFIAMFYILRSGIQWKALPKCLGASSTVHDRFQEWAKAGVFRQLWELGLLQACWEGFLDMEWLTVDGCTTKSPLGGENTGPNPTDRAKTGTKRHLMTEGKGIPISLVVTGANVHDATQVEAMLDNLAVLVPLPTEEEERHFCADKAYDSARIRRTIALQGFKDHILSRGDEKKTLKTPGYRARRWVNERTHSWMNRFRRIIIRWDKKTENYQAFLHLACALIVWRNCEVFGYSHPA
jgi:putative transposase